MQCNLGTARTDGAVVRALSMFNRKSVEGIGFYQAFDEMLQNV